MSVQEDLKDAEEEAEKAESANAMTLIANGGNIMNPAELVDNTLNVDVLCLPCEDEAYGDRLDSEFFPAGHRLADDGVRNAASLTKPLRNDTVLVNSHGFARSWFGEC